jgi:hypothetical protein
MPPGLRNAAGARLGALKRASRRSPRPVLRQEKEDKQNAQIRHRARHSRNWQFNARPVSRHFTKVLKRPPSSGAEYPVAANLRDGRQDLMRLHRSGRKHHSRACDAGRLPGK